MIYTMLYNKILRKVNDIKFCISSITEEGTTHMQINAGSSPINVHYHKEFR